MLSAPSATFLAKIANKPGVLKAVERCQKEFEIYSYLTDRVAGDLTDSDWAKLLESKKVEERVSLWNYIAVKQRREAEDAEKAEQKRNRVIEIYKQQQAKYDQGGMGYGPGMHRMFSDLSAHLKNETELIVDSRQYIAHKLKDMPTLAFDMQYVPTARSLENSNMAQNLRVTIADNRYNMLSPFPLCIFNCDMKSPRVERFFNIVGMLNRENQSEFLPEVHEGNPFLDKQANKDKQILYISRHARDVLDGPLKHDVYILPVAFDHNRESIGGARSGNFRAVSLPIRKYVEWKSGHMGLPLSNLQRMFSIVSQTGGDWHKALHAVIAKRHFITAEEHQRDNSYHRQLAKFNKEERSQVSKTIKEAMGEFNCSTTGV
ncbi:hypothetical protein M3Y97_00239300 [Aphelenchoides bicaudatus]|nr:hypothetical protein M3Y97_00239300 [Aphelenchoides bicaudatus]